LGGSPVRVEGNVIFEIIFVQVYVGLFKKSKHFVVTFFLKDKFLRTFFLKDKFLRSISYKCVWNCKIYFLKLDFFFAVLVYCSYWYLFLVIVHIRKSVQVVLMFVVLSVQ